MVSLTRRESNILLPDRRSFVDSHLVETVAIKFATSPAPQDATVSSRRSKPASVDVAPSHRARALLTQDSVMPRISPRYSVTAPRPLRIGAGTLLIAGVILVMLSGAFLLGLAMIGILAAAIGGLELARRHLGRKPVVAIDQRVAG
jgi:hypothetical protein